MSETAPLNKLELVDYIRTLAPFIEHIDAQDNLLESGLDSMHILQLVNYCRAKGSKVTFTQLIVSPTLADWQTLICQ
ncbi:aryl carrier domain protein [Methylophaga frappieri]|uniref:Aryl carrier domain protein n=1 Tax=Methylophaga frappieri (strain ATCC BAA-2434 / DSM 25690 / JAM7) TaxID=754477 RepID=I1YF76_METFJ|nr:phosphopantetheine-binding protein [Methylophaga frappieri]AFJ01569.1 aryl carrier domain protein [Methylophaga frappieri]